MIEFGTPLALIVLVPVLYLYWRLGRGPREVWAIRAAIVLLAALMLASPAVRTGRRARHLVLLVDRSLSCGREAMDRATETAELLRGHLDAEDRLSMVAFGKGAVAVSRRGTVGEMPEVTFEDASDLTAGLNLAASLLAGRQGGRVVVVSDGLYTGRDPLEAVPALHKSGVAVDYSPIIREESADVAVTDVRLPERVRQGQPFELSFTIRAPVSAEAVIRVQRQGMDFEQSVTLAPGSRRFTLRDAAGPAGLVRYVVTVSAEGDSRPENNRALAVTNSIGPARVLVLNEQAGADNLTRALETAGMAVTVGGPGMTVTSADLKPYTAVVMDNIALSTLNDRADAALRNFVQETGGGLLVTGGRRSFAAGGYYQSRMEDVLPVSMVRKEHFSRPKLAMAIVLDRSGSMTAPVGIGLNKMDLANRGAAEAVGILMPQDEVAVIAVDSSPHLIVGLAPVGANSGGITKDILRIESTGGGIFVYTGLRAAVSELMESEAPTRHIVLFSDAADSEEPGDYKDLVEAWVRAGGTISVIGLGTDRDRDAAFLIDIARRGGGEVFFTNDPHALPRVFCQDVLRVARKTFLEERTGAVVTPGIIRLGQLGINEFPDFLGYNLCYTKEDAAELIATTDDNAAPVLAVWQRGLGRAAALTVEADGIFTGDLRTWPDYEPFLSSLVKWVQRDQDDVSLFGTITRAGRTATISLEMDRQAARTCTGATALIIPPTEEEAERVPLRWTGPQTMEADLTLDSDGVYHGLILTNEGRRVSLPPVVLPYSPEFEPKPPRAGLKVLQRLADATDGKRLMHVRDLLGTPAALTQEPVDIAPYMAGLLLVLLLCDIVTRKHLWGQLVPAFARRGLARGRDGLVSSAGRLRLRLRRRRMAADGGPTAKAEGPEDAEPAAPEPAPRKRESVFKRAKRRARFGRDDKD